VDDCLDMVGRDGMVVDGGFLGVGQWEGVDRVCVCVCVCYIYNIQLLGQIWGYDYLYMCRSVADSLW
jgi:hypothetical protein